MASKLAPLTERQLKDRAAVVLAYADWWNHLKFKKGWATPLFTFNEVKSLLERAAEIVVRTRSVLDKRDPSFKLRMVDGAAREFLWSLAKKPTPATAPKFVRDLVHATFRDGKGFVEGLTREQLDDYIKQFDPALNVQELQVAEKRDAVFEKLASSWASAAASFESLLKECHDSAGQPSPDVLADEHDLTKLIHHVTDLDEATRACMERFKRRRIVSPVEAGAPAKKHKKKRGKHGRHSNTQPSEPDAASTEATAMDTSDTAAAAAPASEPVVEEPATPATAASDAPAPATETGANEVDESEHAHEDHDEDHAAAEPAHEHEHEHEHEEDGEASDSEGEASDTAKSSADEQQNFTIKVQQVAQDVDIISHGVDVLSEEIRDLDAKLPANPDEAQTVLRKLRGRASQFTDSLLRDMTVLDALSLSEDLRPVRKTQIQAIERLVDTVETISQRLKDLSHTNDARLQDKRKEEAEKAAAEKAAAEAKEKEKQEAAAAAAAAAKASRPAPPKVAEKPVANDAEEEEEEEEEEELTSPDARLASMWRQLKLDVQLDVQDTGAAYVIQGHIPGLRNENIKVQLSSNREALIISGARLPSARELQALKRQRGVSTVDAMLRMGAGRFGSFSQQFRLPGGVDRDAISADYSNAVLRVTIPKVQRQEPVPRAFPGAYGASPYTGRRGAPRGSPFGSAYPHGAYGSPRSFRDDSDFFW